MRRIISAILALVAVTVMLTSCSGTGSVDYEYNGFVIEVYENARGETAIVALWGDVESNFVIRENTRMIAPAERSIAVGDCIMLNTTSTSDENIKECKILPAYSSEGRLVYVEGDDAPFLLATLADGSRLLIRLIDNDQNLHPGISGLGDVIRVYHFSEVLVTEPTAHVEGLIYVENGSPDDLTDEDIAFIISEGYTPRAK